MKATFIRKSILIQVTCFLVLFSIIAILNFSCRKHILKDDTLTLTMQDYTGNQLRIDGYYYQEKNGKFYTMYCFFRNGIVLYLGGGFSPSQITEMEGRIQDGRFYNDVKNLKDYWGVFLIENSNIKFEKWYPSSGGGLPTYIREGNILNDTTFVITEVYRMKNGKKIEAEPHNETYYFKAFSPKPDSTQTFIP